ncbi:hypothetical protein L218DRAFT_95285 [Marasmius fiardii PR-910]|nr:hypothetical protein L218DRAFT_95285 [Marasmius fiardii PR-910]
MLSVEAIAQFAAFSSFLTYTLAFLRTSARSQALSPAQMNRPGYSLTHISQISLGFLRPPRLWVCGATAITGSFMSLYAALKLHFYVNLPSHYLERLILPTQFLHPFINVIFACGIASIGCLALRWLSHFRNNQP